MPTEKKSDAHPLRAAAAVVYGALLIAWLAVPQGLVNWLKDFDPSTPRTTLQRLMQDVEWLSNRIGANGFYERGRALFLAATGKDKE
jgi:hypothetical protein